jgi:dUTP pyrophosphatase
MEPDVNVKIQLLENGTMPTRATEGSAGWDLYAAEDAELRGGETKAVSVGFKVSLPRDIEMQIRSRSGLSLKGVVVANSPGTVDSDFRGEVKVILHCNRPPHYQQTPTKFGGPPAPKAPTTFISKGDRIAQAVFAWVPKLSLVSVSSLDETARGEGGFGSTGK